MRDVQHATGDCERREAMDEQQEAYMDVRLKTDSRAKLLIDIQTFCKTRDDIDLLIDWLRAFKGLLPESASNE